VSGRKKEEEHEESIHFTYLFLRSTSRQSTGARCSKEDERGVRKRIRRNTNNVVSRASSRLGVGNAQCVAPGDGRHFFAFLPFCVLMVILRSQTNNVFLVAEDIGGSKE